MSLFLAHEKLTVYKLAVSVARRVRALRFPVGDSALKDQARRAADSVVLNLAEGAWRNTAEDRQRHFHIARASAAEASAVFDVVDLAEGPALQHDLRQIVAMACSLR